jgi:hypothetical protein
MYLIKHELPLTKIPALFVAGIFVYIINGSRIPAIYAFATSNLLSEVIIRLFIVKKAFSLRTFSFDSFYSKRKR